MAGNDELGKQIEGFNRRMDTLTVEVVDMKNELRSHGDLLRAMQQTQQEMVKSIIQLNTRVDKLDEGQERLISLVARIVDRLADFEVGATVELDNVDYNPTDRTLKGKLRRIAR